MKGTIKLFYRCAKFIFSYCVVAIVIDMILGLGIFITPFHPEIPIIPMTPKLEDIEAFKNRVHRRNLTMANAKLEDIIITITFSKPLNYCELVNYLSRHNVTSYGGAEVRELEVDGTRVSGGTDIADENVSWKEILKQNQLRRKTWQANGYVTEYIGIVSLEGYIDSEDLFDAMDDPMTYFIDTSRDAYFRAYFSSWLYPKNSMRNFTARFKSPGSTFNSSVVWQLEDLKYNGYDYGG